MARSIRTTLQYGGLLCYGAGSPLENLAKSSGPAHPNTAVDQSILSPMSTTCILDMIAPTSAATCAPVFANSDSSMAPARTSYRPRVPARRRSLPAPTTAMILAFREL